MKDEHSFSGNSIIFFASFFVLLISRIFVLTDQYTWPINPLYIEIVFLMLTTCLLLFESGWCISARLSSVGVVYSILILHTVLWGCLFVNNQMAELTNAYFRSQIIFVLIICLTAFYVKKNNLLLYFCVTCFYAVSICLIFSLATHFSELDLSNIINIMSTEERSRSNFGFGHYNTLGGMCACSFFLWLFIRKRNINTVHKTVELVLVCISFVMLLCSASRSSITSIGVFFLQYIVC